MKYQNNLWVIIFCLLHSACSKSGQEDLIKDLLYENRNAFQEVLDHPTQFDVQILYTRIDRDQENRPGLQEFRYRVDPEAYFYPASTVKLPVALLTLERLNDLEIPGLSKFSMMLTDSAWSGQTSVKWDTSTKNPRPTIAGYIKEIFLVSDNDAFNRLFEFLGPDYINNSLHRKGYARSRIVHRLSQPLTPEENRYTNPVRFYDEENRPVYQQGLIQSMESFPEGKKILLGEGYILNDSLFMEPMDFSAKNFIPLQELHNMVVSLVFPQTDNPDSRFNITEADRKFLLTCMSMYPRESADPFHEDQFEDNYCKFLMFGDQSGRIPENIRIFNKIGLAYGFLAESAYIVDFDAGTEFFLSATIHVNKNRIYNDGIYEYDSIGFPFMGNLGRMIYAYEKGRKRKNIPDLTDFIMKY
jgi:hypothetical protein